VCCCRSILSHAPPADGEPLCFCFTPFLFQMKTVGEARSRFVRPFEMGHGLKPAEQAPGLVRVQIRDNRLACNGALTFLHEETLLGRQIDIHPAAETDDSDPLTGRNGVALADRSDNPPCDGSRDKNRADMKRVLCL